MYLDGLKITSLVMTVHCMKRYLNSEFMSKALWSFRIWMNGNPMSFQIWTNQQMRFGDIKYHMKAWDYLEKE